MKILLIVKNTAYLLKASFNGFINDDAIKLSASLSFYTFFSLPPLLIIIMSLSGFFLGEQAVNGEIYVQLSKLVGNNAALQIQQLIKNIKLSNNNYFAAIVSAIILVIGASSVFSEIQDSINYIWGIKTKPKRGFIKFILNRITSFSMIASSGFLLLVSLIINSVLAILNKQLEIYFTQNTIYFFYAMNTLFVFIIITLLFTLIFKTLPDGKVALYDCIIGAIFTAFLFMIGKFVIGFYLGSSTISTVYGATGSIILILLWVYYSAIILYFGAEFTKVYANEYGGKIIPNENTIKINMRL